MTADFQTKVLRSHVRVDGRAKVTGAARFAADFSVPHLAHAAVVTSTIARGRIVGFDLEKARNMPGVLGIFTYQELAGAIKPVKHLMAGGYANSSALPFGSSEIHYAGQIVVLVVAHSSEVAKEAANLVGVHYQEQGAAGVLHQPDAKAEPLASIRSEYKDPVCGDAKQAFEAATIKIDAVYQTPIQHHNPMELFGTTCAWNGDTLTVFEATRYIDAAQHGLAAQLGIDPAKIRILCPFIGGHFGSRLALSQYTAPVALAARQLGRPVRYVATRQECFTIANHRPDTQHHIRIGSTSEGRFTALRHEVEMTTSRFDNFAMEGTDVTASLYAWRNVETKETVVHVDRNTPGPMRAPPEVPYLFALESGIDELAAKLEIDPIELRRRNDTTADPISGKPFTPRALMKCFEAGARAFGWEARPAKPRSLRDGDWLIGYGCSSSVRPVKRGAAAIRIVLSSAGHVTVETAHHEIGNGIYTVLAMEAAAQLGTKIEAVTVRLGDSALPAASISGGSSTTTSLLPVLADGCRRIQGQLAQAAVTGGFFAGLTPQELQLQDGSLVARNGQSIRLPEVFARWGKSQVEVTAEGAPEHTRQEALKKLHEGKLTLGSEEKALQWAYGAQFAEVRVHALSGEIRVPRLTGAFAAGRIMNRLTALSQLRGGMIWGIGSILLEATVIDTRTSRYVNDNLAEYLIATAADAQGVEAILLDDEADTSDLMGLGELGIIGVNAAVANALYHATGKRFRKLPVHLDHLLPVTL